MSFTPTNPIDTTDVCHIRLALNVRYECSGEPAHVLQGNLHHMAHLAIGEGMLTGNSPATVDEHQISTAIMSNSDEGEIMRFLTQQIENGNIAPEDVIERMVRYGLQDPAEFVQEMRERMADTATEA